MPQRDLGVYLEDIEHYAGAAAEPSTGGSGDRSGDYLHGRNEVNIPAKVGDGPSYFLRPWAGRVFSRAQRLDSVHQEMRDVSDRAIDSHVKNLRRKTQAVEPAFEGIVSVYGVGYRFDAPLRK